jgi:hypothetical protein
VPAFFLFLHLDGLKTPIYTQTIVKWVAKFFIFFVHLDGLKTPIYTQTIVKWVARIDGGIQKEPQPKPPLYPSP